MPLTEGLLLIIAAYLGGMTAVMGLVAWLAASLPWPDRHATTPPPPWTDPGPDPTPDPARACVPDTNPCGMTIPNPRPYVPVSDDLPPTMPTGIVLPPIRYTPGRHDMRPRTARAGIVRGYRIVRERKR